jgi:hypothetical protein
VSARPITPAEQRFDPYEGKAPACDDPDVLVRIVDDFAGKESEFWNSTAAIVSIDHVRAIGWRPWGLDHIPRRFCTAIAHLNTNRAHAVSYNIGEDLGFASYGYGVDWCVDGYDRNRAFAPHCKMMRP